jgi:hypothetical protein
MAKWNGPLEEVNEYRWRERICAPLSSRRTFLLFYRH